MQVVILDPVDFVDSSKPTIAETIAMSQALTSRSSVPLHERMDVIRKDYLEFMEKYYVGYGHKSIGQCAPIVISISGVSMIAAKVIQSDAFYNGQEMSTRFIDFSNAKAYNPFADRYGEEDIPRLQQFWFNTTKKVYEALLIALPEKYPKPDEITEQQYNNTIKSKACDIARGFLPCGTLTNLTWSTTIDNARDALKMLLFHPLEELRNLGNLLSAELSKKYQGSFSKILERIEKDSNYLEYMSCKNAFSCHEEDLPTPDYIAITNSSDTLNRIKKYHRENPNIIHDKPKSCRLPRNTELLGNLHLVFNIDFGSWRDLQRHRIGYIPFPTIQTKQILSDSWYMQQIQRELPELYEAMKDSVEYTVHCCNHWMAKSQKNSCLNEALYYLPMMIKLQADMIVPYHQLVYILETRTAQNVHPSLRVVMLNLVNKLKELNIPIFDTINQAKNLSIYWPRGEQTIEERKS